MPEVASRIATLVGRARAAQRIADAYDQARVDELVLAAGWAIMEPARNRTLSEIAAWSTWQDQRAPNNTDGREYLNGLHKSGAPNREDIVSWFDVLDMDDFVSFGGKA